MRLAYVYIIISLILLPHTTVAMERLPNAVNQAIERYRQRQTAKRQEQLPLAAQKGDLKKVVSILQDPGVDINHQYGQSGPALCTAISSLGLDAPWQNGYNVIKYLITHGADITLPNAKGNTPLYCALKLKNKVRVVPDQLFFVLSYLFAKGAPVNVSNKRGSTPLHCATKYSFDQAVTVLLQKGAAVGAHNNAYTTPFDIAMRRADFSTAQLLIDNQLQHIRQGTEHPKLARMDDVLAYACIEIDDPNSRFLKNQTRAELEAKIIHMLQHGVSLQGGPGTLVGRGDKYVIKYVIDPLLDALLERNYDTVKRFLDQGVYVSYLFKVDDHPKLRTWLVMNNLIKCAARQEQFRLHEIACMGSQPSYDILRLMINKGPWIDESEVRRMYTYGSIEHVKLLFTHIPQSRIERTIKRIAFPLLLGLRRHSYFPLDLRKLITYYCVRQDCIDEHLAVCKQRFRVKVFNDSPFGGHSEYVDFMPLKSGQDSRDNQYRYDYEHLLDNIPLWKEQIYRVLMRQCTPRNQEHYD